MGVGLGGGPRLHPLGAHVRPGHGLVRHLLVQRRVLRDVRGAEDPARRGRAGRHHKGDAADRLRGQPLRDLLLRQPVRGLAHRQVRGLDQDPGERRPRPGGLHVLDRDLHEPATPELEQRRRGRRHVAAAVRRARDRRHRHHRRRRLLPQARQRGRPGLSRARYIGGKLLAAVGTLLFVLVLNFFLFRILPGDPERTLTRLQRISPSAIDEVRKEFGLDRPLSVQFIDYLGDTARGELGISYVFSRPVSEVIGSALWPTILLVGVATVAATVIGTLMGIWGAWRRGSAIDTSLLGFGLVTYAMPEFWLGMLLILAFAVALDWFPTSFMSTPSLAEASAGAQLVDTLEHLFLPALTLVLALLGEYALIMRSSVIEAMNEDYVSTARAKGMREALVLRKHIVPNALLPVVTRSEERRVGKECRSRWSPYH